MIIDIDKLTLAEKETLLSALRSSIAEERASDRRSQRVAEVIEAMEDASGNVFDYESRKLAGVWERTIVAHHLLQEGYTTVEVGRALHRDHSSVIVMRERMNYALKHQKQYIPEMKLNNRFKTTLKRYETI